MFTFAPEYFTALSMRLENGCSQLLYIAQYGELVGSFVLERFGRKSVKRARASDTFCQKLAQDRPETN